MNELFSRAGMLLSVFAAACGAPDDSPAVNPPPPPPPPSDTAPAPSYTELFERYFAPGTPGHCATSGCHADPGHNVWLCATKDDCYDGMVQVGLIDSARPAHSAIADGARSPLTWINPAGGNMPLDAQLENPDARAAILAWVAAGARDD